MTTGRVNWFLEAIVRVEIQDAEGYFHSIHCILDTGYDGDILLSSNIIERLKLVPDNNRPVILADGARISMEAYDATVSWGDQLIDVTVLETAGESLIGMALLENSTLTVQVWDGGEVLIEPR